MSNLNKIKDPDFYNTLFKIVHSVNASNKKYLLDKIDVLKKQLVNHSHKDIEKDISSLNKTIESIEEYIDSVGSDIKNIESMGEKIDSISDSLSGEIENIESMSQKIDAISDSLSENKTINIGDVKYLERSLRQIRQGIKEKADKDHTHDEYATEDKVKQLEKDIKRYTKRVGGHGHSNLTALQAITNSGEGNKYLLDDGTYRQDIIIDTLDAILAETPNNGVKAYATDKDKLYIYMDGWKEGDTIWNDRDNSVDMGKEQNSSLSGYGEDYITDKTLSNTSIGGNSDTNEGGVRTIESTTLGRRLAQFFLDGSRQTVLTGVNIQTDKDEPVADIEFTDFAPWVLSLITGNSDSKDLDGVPKVQNMKTDMGAYQAPLLIDGGTF